MTYNPAVTAARGKLLAVAPMMNWTDRHCRYFHRQLTRRTLLYTEMITALAIRHGDRQRLLGFDPREQPVALQVGGSDPALLAEAARWGEDFGYCEINLNVGCPSERVREGRFGACLMAEPELVRDCVGAMRQAVKVPVTVKCRIGIDDQDDDLGLEAFVGTVAQSGCETFIVHARKAWLKGLSPRENREIPPLNYDRVYRLKRQHPDLAIVINGGIGSLAEASVHLAHVDGVMLGRAAYHTPWLLADADQVIHGAVNPVARREDAVLAMLDYVREQASRGVWLHNISRHMLGLFHGMPGGKAWRRILSEQAHRPGAGPDVIIRALEGVERAAANRWAA